MIQINLEERFWGKTIQLDILGQQGRPIIQSQADNAPSQVNVDVADLTPGIYVLYATLNGKRTYIGRFIKANP